MAFFRTINFSEALPSIAGEGVMLRTPQVTDYSTIGRRCVRRAANFLVALGADLARRRL
jgi:hypothetical protein